MSDVQSGPLSPHPFARLALRIMLIAGALVIVCIAGVVGALLVLSPGTSAPFLDESGHVLAGSISEKLHVTINGVEQGMFIRGRDKTKPVLLFLHGGPGMPEFAVSQNYPAVLETCSSCAGGSSAAAGCRSAPIFHRQHSPRRNWCPIRWR